MYSDLHDQIIEKRFHAASPIRRHAHHAQYHVFVDLVPAGATVIDSGCGEGVLSVLLAQKGCTVTGVDLSEPNIEAAKKYAAEQGVSDRCTFLVGDAEALPVPDKSFDYAVSSHVLEHVPDFTKGASELSRVTKQNAIIAIPTCLNLCSLVQLGGDKYWAISRRTPYAIFVGFLRVLFAFVTGKEGVNEGYAGRKDLVHILRFPWRGKTLIETGNLRVRSYQASSLVIPYVSWFVPLSKFLLKGSHLPILRNFGYGTTYICMPVQAS